MLFHAPYAEVEATIVDLDEHAEQLCDGYLEPLDTNGQIDESGNAAPDAALGVRLAYRVTYDPQSDAFEQVVFFPLRSEPQVAQYARVPAAVRRVLPVVVLNDTRPLQLRAEGLLRRLVTDRDTEAAAGAFRALEQAVAAATTALSAEPAIAATVDAVFQAGGVGRRLGDAPVTATAVQFRPDDGSLSALLRAVQPALDLDDDGLLTLTSTDRPPQRSSPPQRHWCSPCQYPGESYSVTTSATASTPRPPSTSRLCSDPAPSKIGRAHV